MTGRNALPRICIALGFSDVKELLAHAAQATREDVRRTLG